ncbi:MAG: fimbrillin family protein [Rikenellaceae bacterium]
MIKRIYALMLLPLLAAGCDKSELANDTPNGDTAISFTTEELTADWGSKSSTRGVAVDDVNSVSSIMIYSFLTNPEEYVTSPYINHKAAEKGDDNYWSFEIPEYYPGDGSTLDFLAYTPAANATSGGDNNGITQTLDFENKSVKFSYVTPIVGRNHPDLMLATPEVEKSSTSPLDNLQFEHALTQLSMSASVGNVTPENRYVITRFTFHDITTGATMDYSVDSGIGDWTPTAGGDFIVSAMLPDPTIEGETQVKLTKEDKSIMSNGHTLFMIPQEIDGKATIQITIYDTDPDSDLTYRTDRLTLPAPTGKSGWEAGDHVNLQFVFDVNDDNLVIDMTLEAKLLDWVEQDVDKEVDANIYAFLSHEEISGNTTVTLYTNGVATEVTTDGTIITGATLGSADGNGYYPITLTTSGTGEGSITVKIENSHETTITKTFSITVK